MNIDHAELAELLESVQLELDAIHHEVYDLGNALDLLRRKLVNVCENLADVLGEPPAPELVLELGPVADREQQLLDGLRVQYDEVFAAPSSFAFQLEEVDR